MVFLSANFPVIHARLRTLTLLGLLGTGLLCALLGNAAEVVQATVAHDFGRVLKGTPVRHSFQVENPRGEAFRLARIDKSPGIDIDGVFAEISPAGTATLTVSLDTRPLNGRYRGLVMLYGDGAKTPDRTFALTGEILPPVSVEPRPVVFLVASRGEELSKAIDLVNHEESPLAITEVRHPTDRFSTTVETLEDGRRYRLHIAINPSGPGGKHTESIGIKTTSLALPEVGVTVNSYLRERVYTFPESVDLGTIRLADLQREPDALRRLSQELMVYSYGARDLRIETHSALPFLGIAAEKGPLGDRYQITISLRKEKMTSGSINGSIEIRTNDPDVPRLMVPVTGRVIGNSLRRTD
jgi:hypothetical protein